jgi:two-component system, sporulation sensor kinase E
MTPKTQTSGERRAPAKTARKHADSLMDLASRDALSSVLEVAKSLVPADGFAVWRVGPDKITWNTVASYGLSAEFAATPSQGDHGMPETPVIAEDVYKFTRLAERTRAYQLEGIRSMLAVPLNLREGRTGSICFYFRKLHKFTDDEIARATALAKLTSSAIASSELYREEARAKEGSDFLADASSVLASSHNVEETLRAVANMAVPRIADWCAIDLTNADGSLRRLTVTHSDPEKIKLGHEIHEKYPAKISTEFGVGKILATRKPELIPRMTDEMLVLAAQSADHLRRLRELGLCSLMVVPLVVHGKSIGLITLVAAESGRVFDDADLTLASTLGNRSAVAIENAQLFESMRESESKFRAVSETASCAICIYDGHRLVYVNHATEELCGYTREELEASSLWELIHPDDREMVKARAESRFRGDATPNRYEYRIIRKDGSIAWLDFTAARIEFGGHQALLATVFDITERKLAQQQLQTRELEARTLLQNIPDVVSRFDRELRFLYVSPQAERLWGRPYSEYTGKTLSEAGIPAPLVEYLSKSVQGIFESGKPANIEFTRELEHGVRHFVGTGVPELTREGRAESVLTITRDVTEQRTAQDALRRSEANLRVITDTIPSLVAYINTDERFVRINKPFVQWFQQPLPAIVGQTIEEVLGAENYKRVREKVKRVLRGEAVQFEANNVYADRPRQVLINYAPDFDESGSVRGFVALVMDVTDRKLAEDALRRSEKLATAGRLAATIAHEINNPLEAITNLLFLIKNEPAGSEQLHTFIDMADHELRRVSHITRQTLGFYRDSVGPTRFDVSAVVEDVLSLLGRRTSVKQIELQRDMDTPGTLIAPQGEVRQIVANLLTNAIDATEGGRVIIRVRKTHCPHTDLNAVTLTVADTGQGIPKQNLQRLFEPFFTTKKDVGTGLGLWVTRELVEKNGGTIRVRSREGEGTVFRVTLPELPPTVG